MVNSSAWIHDLIGLEKEAIPYYEKAISLGLDNHDLKEACLGLGGTCRAVGEYEKSKKRLLDGLEQFNGNILKVFLSMTCYTFNKHEEAMRLFL